MRDITLEESYEVITRHLDIEDEFINFKNHKRYERRENTYRFTVNLVSLDFLIALMEEKSVDNVFFNPSVPPPGSTTEGVSLRYKVYVQYDKVEE
tara:strand:+ start:330 stop:614 length:285 start_codon:yes stop_codon:yes gene_type:complete